MMSLTAKLYEETMDVGSYCPQCGKGCGSSAACEFMPGSPPEVPMIVEPQPVSVGILEINSPGRDSPVIVTCNYLHTHTLLGEILIHAGVDCHILSMDTGGDPVDMAVVKGKFTGDAVKEAAEDSGLAEKTDHTRLILPGLCEVDKVDGWEVVKGPVCALELPLFLRFRY
jgi:acetyl-CoA decarbonylase/synthase complex subunit gamma